MKPNMKQVCS